MGRGCLLRKINTFDFIILSSFIISPLDSYKNIIDLYTKESLLKHYLDAFAYT